MKRLFLIVCVVSAFTALATEDSYLYWMVADTIKLDGVDYSYDSLSARVVAYNSNTWPGDGSKIQLSLYGQNGEGPDFDNGVSSVTANNGDNSPYYAGIAPAVQEAGWSYFIELYNDDRFYARSEQGIDYMTAKAGDYLFGSDFSPASSWTVSNFTTTPAPEPNSAMLLLIGCAALALRRRKQIAA